MAGYGYNEAMSDTYDSYLDMKKKRSYTSNDGL